MDLNKCLVLLKNLDSFIEKHTSLFEDWVATSNALYEAIEALEKQIPKSPIIETYDNFKAHKCPNCKYGLTNRLHNYCYRCGQRLDLI